ncbi:MAG: DUF1573 domain-containing protein [Anaerolineae bacterium]|nr:DUF1573 domain-containing protein [Anaerolineae bacterium]
MTKRLRKASHRQKTTTSPYLIAGIGTVLLVIVGAFFLLRGGDEDVTKEIDPNFTPDVTGSPRLEVAQDIQDFGDVPFEQMVTSAFTIKNVGDEPLVIQREPQVELVRGC